jgi:hypothetical protein
MSLAVQSWVSNRSASASPPCCMFSNRGPAPLFYCHTKYTTVPFFCQVTLESSTWDDGTVGHTGTYSSCPRRALAVWLLPSPFGKVRARLRMPWIDHDQASVRSEGFSPSCALRRILRPPPYPLPSREGSSLRSALPERGRRPHTRQLTLQQPSSPHPRQPSR